MGRMDAPAGPHVIRAGEGDVTGEPGLLDRYLLESAASAGRIALRGLEIIVPGGIEAMFRRLAEPGGEYSPDTLPALAAEYGAEVDFEATMPLVERHGLVF